MRSIRKRFIGVYKRGFPLHHGPLAGFFLVLWTVATPAIGYANENEQNGWRFSASVGIVAQAQRAEGTAENSFSDREFFASSVSDDPLVLVPTIPVGAQIEGPTFEGALGLRAFVHGRFVIAIDADRTLARDGTIPNPVEVINDLPANLPADTVSGQGTLLRGILKGSGQVGAGVSMELPIGQLVSRVGISIDYMAQRMRLDGEVIHVSGTGPQEQAPFTVQRLGGSEDTLFHFLGPQMEIEFPVWEEGPLQVGVLAEAGAFFALGDRSRAFTSSDGSDLARFEVEVDPWLIRAGVGLRISWKGAW